MLLLRARRAAVVSPERRLDESAVRGRTARKVRSHLRRQEPVALWTPRWSAPQAFLEDIALDLAAGQSLGCRTVSCRPMQGRAVHEAWGFVLRVLAGVAGPHWSARPLPVVADRRGFVHVARALLTEAHETRAEHTALLLHGVHHLPAEVLEDLSFALSSFLASVGAERRLNVLLAGAIRTPLLAVEGAVSVELSDYAPAEAEASVLAATGPVRAEALARAVRFTGGVPALVQAVAAGVRARGGVPRHDGELLSSMGDVLADLRAAVSMALTVPANADRLHALLDGAPHPEDPAVDGPLREAGLVRAVRGLGVPRVELRAPAVAALCLA
jgi:hypothetical protein